MELLSGWKEIAERLHLGIRTAQRWERLGLPVRRVSDSPCSPVVAIPDEIELWARTRDVRSDANLLATNRFLMGQGVALREKHARARRQTRSLLNSLNSLGNEQKELIHRIQTSLVRPRGMNLESHQAPGNSGTPPAEERRTHVSCTPPQVESFDPHRCAP